MEYKADRCGYCGACVAVCPHEILKQDENEIIIKEGCDDCGNCTVVCPLGALNQERNNHEI
jgi:ferredoxin